MGAGAAPRCRIPHVGMCGETWRPRGAPTCMHRTHSRPTPLLSIATALLGSKGVEADATLGAPPPKPVRFGRAACEGRRLGCLALSDGRVPREAPQKGSLRRHDQAGPDPEPGHQGGTEKWVPRQVSESKKLPQTGGRPIDVRQMAVTENQFLRASVGSPSRPCDAACRGPGPRTQLGPLVPAARSDTPTNLGHASLVEPCETGRKSGWEPARKAHISIQSGACGAGSHPPWTCGPFTRRSDGPPMTSLQRVPWAAPCGMRTRSAPKCGRSCLKRVLGVKRLLDDCGTSGAQVIVAAWRERADYSRKRGLRATDSSALRLWMRDVAAG